MLCLYICWWHHNFSHYIFLTPLLFCATAGNTCFSSLWNVLCSHLRYLPMTHDHLVRLKNTFLGPSKQCIFFTLNPLKHYFPSASQSNLLKNWELQILDLNMYTYFMKERQKWDQLGEREGQWREKGLYKCIRAINIIYIYVYICLCVYVCICHNETSNLPIITLIKNNLNTNWVYPLLPTVF